MKDGISIVVPAFNEEEGIGGFLAELVPVLRGLGRPYEVLVVDDGSTDATVEKIAEWTARDPAVRAIPLGRNHGLGAAIATGFAAAALPLIGYCDADSPFRMNLWGPAIWYLEDTGADLLCGVRLNQHAAGPVRYVYSKGFNLLARAALGLSVRDINAPFKIVRARALAGITLSSERSLIDAELIDKVSRAGGRIVEFPFVYRVRTEGATKLGNAGNAARTFADLVGYARAAGRAGR